MYNNWEYGKLMLLQGDIDSLDNWSDDKEYVYSILDQDFSYLWMNYNSDETGYVFVDRLFYDGIEDELVKAKRKNNETALFFATLDRAKAWIENARKEGKYK